MGLEEWNFMLFQYLEDAKTVFYCISVPVMPHLGIRNCSEKHNTHTDPNICSFYSDLPQILLVSNCQQQSLKDLKQRISIKLFYSLKKKKVTQ